MVPTHPGLSPEWAKIGWVRLQAGDRRTRSVPLTGSPYQPTTVARLGPAMELIGPGTTREPIESRKALRVLRAKRRLLSEDRPLRRRPLSEDRPLARRHSA